MRVELDAFSGLPSPAWDLPDPEASDLAEKIESLPRVDARPHVPDLGYRGFLLRLRDESIRVFQGYVIREESGRDTMYRDTANIESQLAADARARGYGDVVRTIRSPR